MTDDKSKGPSWPRYAGRGVPNLAAAGASIPMPDQNAATFRPKPMLVRNELFARFAEALGTDRMNLDRPHLTISDVRAIANFTTFALRNDLPLYDPRDAVVIWEKWRRAVVDIGDVIRVGNHPEVASGASRTTAAIATQMIDGRTTMIALDLIDAGKEKGLVYSRFCPWRDPWASTRIQPERAR